MGASLRVVILTTLMLLAGSTAGVLLLLSDPCRRRLFAVLPTAWGRAWSESVKLYRRGQAPMAGCFCLSIASNVAGIGAFPVAAGLLGDNVPWTETFLAAPAIIIANCLPLTPGGLGVAEMVASHLFDGLGYASGAEMMLLVRVCILALASFGVIGLFLVGDSRRRDG
jgi:uncharacterized membrane protein YbhN (UPF0104 family)